ncbi:hypothetical protein D3C85_1054680 [compost metagenome]
MDAPERAHELVHPKLSFKLKNGQPGRGVWLDIAVLPLRIARLGHTARLGPIDLGSTLRPNQQRGGFATGLGVELGEISPREKFGELFSEGSQHQAVRAVGHEEEAKLLKQRLTRLRLIAAAVEKLLGVNVGDPRSGCLSKRKEVFGASASFRIAGRMKHPDMAGWPDKRHAETPFREFYGKCILLSLQPHLDATDRRSTAIGAVAHPYCHAS